ncbi:MAG: AI-2E family transporter [Myxococcaceae bacterium]|nr:AI-2E family transporter [Myxococcaceae bacterium]
MRRDRLADFFREKTPKRALALVAFLALLLVFRKLLVLLAFFVAFERLLFWSAGLVSRRFKLSRVVSLGLVLVLVSVAAGLGGWLSAGRVAQLVKETRQTLPERIAAVRENPLFLELEPHLPDTERLVESAQHYAANVAKSAADLGHLVIYALVGFILAVVYFLDEERLRSFRQSLAPDSLFGTLTRWGEFVADAVSLTVQLQFIVAAANALLTLPVLLLIGVPHVPMLMLLIFVSGLIPVVGNLISGAVLSVVAYQTKGFVGVGLFIGLTFVLHKLESYFLNPRLAARHVPLPGFVLILSLIAWEHLLGFVGLFVSFPFLYVAGKLITEFKEEDAPVTPPAEPAPVNQAPAQAS